MTNEQKQKIKSALGKFMFPLDIENHVFPMIEEIRSATIQEAKECVPNIAPHEPHKDDKTWCGFCGFETCRKEILAALDRLTHQESMEE